MFAVPFEHYPRVKQHEEYKSMLLKQLWLNHNHTEHGMRTDFFHNDKEKIIPAYYKIVTSALDEYLQEIEGNVGFRLKICSMWYQMTSGGQSHQVHTHGATGLSCVWYLEFDPEVHKATTFYAPFHDPLSGDMIQHTPEVQEGDLVVFPSFLMHEQEGNDSDKRRTIISFNIEGRPKPIMKYT